MWTPPSTTRTSTGTGYWRLRSPFARQATFVQTESAERLQHEDERAVLIADGDSPAYYTRTNDTNAPPPPAQAPSTALRLRRALPPLLTPQLLQQQQRLRLQLLTRWLRRASSSLSLRRNSSKSTYGNGTSPGSPTAATAEDEPFVHLPQARSKRGLTLMLPRGFSFPRFSRRKRAAAQAASDREGLLDHGQPGEEAEATVSDELVDDIQFLYDEVLPTQYLAVWEQRHSGDGKIQRYSHELLQTNDWDSAMIPSSAEQTLVWLDIENPHEKDAAQVAELLELGPDAAKKIISTFEQSLERVDFDRRFVMIGIRLSLDRDTVIAGTAPPLNNSITGGYLLFIMHKRMAVSLHTGPVPLLHQAFLAASRLNVAISPERVLHLIYYAAHQQWLPVVRAINDDVEVLEDIISALSNDDRNDAILRVNTTRVLVVQLSRDLGGKSALLHTISASMARPVRTQPYVRETLFRLDDLVESLRACSDTLNELQKSFIAKVTLETSEAADKVGYSSKMFAIIATIAVPIQSLGGVAGMNIYFPSHIDATDPTSQMYYEAFWVIVLMQIFMCICMFGLLHLMKVL